MSSLVKVGSSYLFHTPLGIWLGTVAHVEPDEVLVNECSWIPDQGRMNECVTKGTYNECEPVGDGVVIPRGFIAVPWRHKLPKEPR